MSELVIDASVGLQANGLDLPAGPECRSVLQTIYKDAQHRAVFTHHLEAEWRRPATDRAMAYSMQWLTAMKRRGRVVDVTVQADSQPSLGEAIQRYAEPEDAQAMMEDLHLIDAARAAGQTVLSRDQEVRRCFASVCQHGALAILREIHWANPADPTEEVCTWLIRGAPREFHRALSFYAPRTR